MGGETKDCNTCTSSGPLMQEAGAILAERLGPEVLQPTGYAVYDWGADQWSEGCRICAETRRGY